MIMVSRSEEGGQQVHCTEHGRQHGRKTQGGVQDICKSAEIINAYIIPVLNKSIQPFKIPPENRTDGKEKKKSTGISKQQAGTGTSESDPVDRQNISRPEREKGV